MKMPTVDSLRSLIGNLGNPERDKAAATHFVHNEISSSELIAAYKSNWIARKIVDIPARDSLRKWRIWSGDDDGLIVKEEVRLRLRQKTLRALTMGRLYGGACIYIGTEQDPEEPLDAEAINQGDLKYLTVLTREEIQCGEIEEDVLSENHGRPKFYTITGSTNQVNIHPSHLAIFHGDATPELWGATGVDAGWDQSVLQAAYESIRNAGGTFSNVASLVFEANVDVIGIPEMMAQIGTANYESNILKRFQLAAQGKGINGTLLLDAEETYNRRSASFASLTDVMREFATHCAAAADIPATRFLAQSPGGLQSTGDSDMNNYHDRLQSMQTLDIQPEMELLDRVLVRSATGSESEDIRFEWCPFEQMGEDEIAAIGKTIAETIKILDETGVLMPDELRELAVARLAESRAFPNIEDIINLTRTDLDFEDDDEVVPEDPESELG